MKKPVKIMLDTDMGCDCDDAGALAVLHELANQGECEILSVTHCYQGPGYAGCIDAINRHYGRSDIPVGVFAAGGEAPVADIEMYASAVAEAFPSRYPVGAPCPDTLDVLRRTLAAAQDGEVTLAVVGSLYSIMRLLESGPDAISPLSGAELIRRKIIRTVIMGGHMHKNGSEVFADFGEAEPEFNIRSDIRAAQTVCRRWPGEIVFCDFEIGVALHAGARLEREGWPASPVSFAYRTWHAGVKSSQVGRESWDLATVLYAVRPDDGLWELHPFGRVDVDGRGVTIWREDSEGRHTFMLEKAPLEEVRRTIDELLERDLEREK